MQLISKLKSKDTKGHDLISSNLLKAIKHEIVQPFTFIINQSLKTGTFPDRLKVARVRALFKKGDNQLITITGQYQYYHRYLKYLKKSCTCN